MESLSPLLSGLLAVVLFTAFVRIFTSLSILGVGLGLRGSGFGLVVFAISLVLSLVAIEPFSGAQGQGVSGLLGSNTAQLEERMRPFMEKHTDGAVRENLQRIAAKRSGDTEGPTSTPSTMVAGFLISEVREAFRLGFYFLIPFLVIDLLVTNALMLLGVKQLSATVVSLPLKLLLFVAVDGWNLVIGRLLGLYSGN